MNLNVREKRKEYVKKRRREIKKMINVKIKGKRDKKKMKKKNINKET